MNERHYGALTGLNKDEMKLKLGEEKVHQFRRSWDLRPDPLDKKNPHHPINIDAVSYTHLRAHETGALSRMPSSA